MKYEIKYKPSYAMLVVNLDQGETVTAEAGAMTYMDPAIEPHTRKREQSFWGTLGLSLIGGQSFFVNDYTARKNNAEVGFVAAPVGDIEKLEVKPNQGYVIQKSAYIASTQGIDLDIKWEGFSKGLFGQGLPAAIRRTDQSIFPGAFKSPIFKSEFSTNNARDAVPAQSVR